MVIEGLLLRSKESGRPVVISNPVSCGNIHAFLGTRMWELVLQVSAPVLIYRR
jgi:hypothetical protein